MGVANKQIGWSQESSLLHAILKQLERLGGTMIGAVETAFTNVTSQITITTGSNITASTEVGGVGQSGRNVIINNGATPINYTVDAVDGFNASYLKIGTATITFVAGAGRTLVPMDGISVLNGVAGSRATILSAGTVDYLYVTNY